MTVLTIGLLVFIAFTIQVFGDIGHDLLVKKAQTGTHEALVENAYKACTDMPREWIEEKSGTSDSLSQRCFTVQAEYLSNLEKALSDTLKAAKH